MKRTIINIAAGLAFSCVTILPLWAADNGTRTHEATEADVYLFMSWRYFTRGDLWSSFLFCLALDETVEEWIGYPYTMRTLVLALGLALIWFGLRRWRRRAA